MVKQTQIHKSTKKTWIIGSMLLSLAVGVGGCSQSTTEAQPSTANPGTSQTQPSTTNPDSSTKSKSSTTNPDSSSQTQPSTTNPDPE